MQASYCEHPRASTLKSFVNISPPLKELDFSNPAVSLPQMETEVLLPGGCPSLTQWVEVANLTPEKHNDMRVESGGIQ